MMGGAMKVIFCNSDQCTIHSGGSRFGIYFAVGCLLLSVWPIYKARFSSDPTQRLPVGPSTWIGLFIFIVVIPIFLSGSTNTVSLSRATGSATIDSTQFFVIKNSNSIPLREISGAANGGRNNQLRLNLADGNYVYIGHDTFEGGRQNAADAINDWLSTYRGSGAR